ncbi:MAG: leucine-rich repeat domain-containing protein [Acutalibacteraceae bacterium]
MKNAIKVVVFTIVVLALCAGGIFGYIRYLNADFTVAEGTKSGTVEITGYYGSDKNVKIPKRIMGKKVASIAESSFNKSDIVSVEIPSTVISIGKDAFSSCTELESVTLPSSLESIGDFAFAKCDKLEKINIPSSLKALGDGVFLLCDSLKDIDIQDGAAFTLKDGILYDSSFTTVYWTSAEADLKNYRFPDTVKTYGGYAFAFNDDIKSFEFPQGTQTVSSSVFIGCKSLESVKIPNGVKTIEECAFLGCESLKSIEIPASVIKIGDLAFPGMGEDPDDDQKTDFTLKVYDGSKALEYAQKYNLKYEIIK